MTEAMPFLQKAILLSYAPRPFGPGVFLSHLIPQRVRSAPLAKVYMLVE